MDAAFDVFSRVGYLNATLSEIAKGANLTVPGVTHHFPNKADLLEAVLNRRDEDAVTRLDGRVGIDMLRGLVEIAARDENNASITRMSAIVAAEATDPAHPAHAFFARRYALIFEWVERAFREVKAAGELREGVSTADAAHAYIALSEGLQREMLYHPGTVSQSAIIKRILESFLTRPL